MLPLSPYPTRRGPIWVPNPIGQGEGLRTWSVDLIKWKSKVKSLAVAIVCLPMFLRKSESKERRESYTIGEQRTSRKLYDRRATQRWKNHKQQNFEQFNWRRKRTSRVEKVFIDFSINASTITVEKMDGHDKKKFEIAEIKKSKWAGLWNSTVQVAPSVHTGI